MERRILVPLDGTDMAARVLPFAATLGRVAGAQLILAHVMAPGQFPQIEEAQLARAVDQLRQDGVDLEPEVVLLPIGDPATSIADAARAQSADLIVMATHGRGTIGRVLFGAVADQVVRYALVPVVLISTAREYTMSGEQPLRILLPLDGSALSEQAILHALSLATRRDSRALLLSVVDVRAGATIGRSAYLGPDADAILAGTRRYLEGVAAPLLAKGVPVEVLTAVGVPDVVIAAVAWEQEADLIALTTHGRGGLSRVLSGSVATHLLQHARVPLLLVGPACLNHNVRGHEDESIGHTP